MSNGSLLLRDVRLVDLDQDAGPGGPSAADRRVDLLLHDGVVQRVAEPGSDGRADEILDGGGAFVIPGLWDQHVHMDQWALQQVRLDTSTATGPGDVLDLLKARVAELGEDRTSAIQGFGHRAASWTAPRTAVALDEVVGDRPVVLISGDAHHGWLSTAALRALGLPSGPGAGVVEETQWFAAYARLGEVFGPDPRLDDGLAAAIADANARGVVGVVDLEFGSALDSWPARFARGLCTLRVRASTYDTGLDAAIDRGLRTGDVLDDGGLLTMGPLKLISDGSLNTRTAWCCQPYCDNDSRGVQNYTGDQLVDLLGRAARAGVECAVHAIGDAAVSVALDAFATTRAAGSIEHAQLVAWSDLARMARLGLRASVQPAHLLDDRDVTDVCWADRTERSFALRAMLDAGVTLAMGSDAPVSPLDPWLAVAAAVHRSADDRPAWHPEQALTAREAIAASVDGRRVRPGAPGDLVLLSADPTVLHGDSDEQGAMLRAVRPLATFVAGRLVHQR